MSRTVISFVLDETSIDRAIREVRQYRRTLLQKLDLLRERVAERIAWSAAHGFAVALADDRLGEDAPRSDVRVSVTGDGKVSIVLAEGEDAAFIEFGAGVADNGSAGSSPHPYGAELGLTIGSYGKGNGRKRVWGFYGEDGELHFTRGTPAAMPMYRAAREAAEAVADLAREVFMA